MTPIKKSLEMMAKDRQAFYMTLLAGATLLRLTQIAFSQQQTLTLAVTTQPFSRRNYARASLWSTTMQEGYAIFNRVMSTCLGIYRPVSQLSQNHFLGSDQEYNRHLCQRLISELKNTQHWLTFFSNDLGKNLKFFYEVDASAISFQEKQKILIFVLRLNDLKRVNGYLQTLSHREFLALVQLVIGHSLRNITEAQFKNIDKIWSFFSFAAQGEEIEIVQDIFRRFPILLKIFVQTVTSPGCRENLNTMETVGNLGDTIELLKNNSELHFALLNGKVDLFSNTSAPTSVAQIQEKLEENANQCNAEWKKSKIRKVLGPDHRPHQVELVYNHYQSAWMIYPIECYLQAIITAYKNPSSNRVILHQFATDLELLPKPDVDKFNKDVSKVCFESYIDILLKDETSDLQLMSSELIDGLFPDFVHFLEGTAQDRETALLVLNNMGLFFRECAEYKRQGYPPALMVQNIQFFFRNCLNFYQMKTLCYFIDFFDLQLRGIYSDQMRWRAIITPIQKSPFTIIASVAVPFIRQLIPQGKHACVDQFEAGLPALKPFLIRNEIYFDLAQTLRDPQIEKLTERAEFGRTVWLFLGDLKTQLSQFLKRRSEVAGTAGEGGVMEKPLICLIENIKSAQVLRQEMVRNRVSTQGREARVYLKGKKSGAKLQEWLVVELPELISDLKKISPLLYLMTSFMKLSLGSLHIGTSLITDFLGALSGLLKLDFVSNFIASQARKDNPDAALADFLEELTHEQRETLIPILKARVIPLVTELLPVLQQNHNLGFYKAFFVYLDGVIKANELNQEKLEKQVASALLHMIGEVEKYKPAVHKTLQYVWENADLSVLDERPKSSSNNTNRPLQIEEVLD